MVKFDKKIKDFSVGHDHLLVLDAEGILWGVGSNAYGQYLNEVPTGTLRCL